MRETTQFSEMSSPPDAPKFFATVAGDCMQPEYKAGELVLFEVKDEPIVNGHTYFVATIDGRQLMRRVYARGEMLELRFWNDWYEPQEIERSEVKLLARAVYKLVPVK